ncbi:MAG TPA: hypothetical protein VM791_02820 [Vicinamibacterales bacterium]|nr:hypothetical protein [Vicinamibacterales bacterium]
MLKIVLSVLASAVLIAVISAPPPVAQTALPARLDTYLTKVVKPTADERQALLRGAPVTRLLDADENKEVAVFGAIWIGAPIKKYLDAVSDIERFESGGSFKLTKRISATPRLEDFAQLHLPGEDVKDLQTCQVGKCEVKLGEEALRRFRTQVDWKGSKTNASADKVMQQLAFEYVNGYLEGGNERLAVYRDTSRPTFVANEFRAMTGRMPELTSYMPGLRNYLLEYPKVALPTATSFLYWQETQFGLKPTIRISHLTIREGRDDAVVTSKMLYASHYFWTGIELRALLADPARGTGFWFVTVNRSRSDGLSGFSGNFVRGRVRSEVQESTLAALRAAKARLEPAR